MSDSQGAAPLVQKRSNYVFELALFAAVSWSIITLYSTVTRVESRVADLEAFADRITQPRAPPRVSKKRPVVEKKEHTKPESAEVELEEEEEEEEEEEPPSVS